MTKSSELANCGTVDRGTVGTGCVSESVRTSVRTANMVVSGHNSQKTPLPLCIYNLCKLGNRVMRETDTQTHFSVHSSTLGVATGKRSTQVNNRPHSGPNDTPRPMTYPALASPRHTLTHTTVPGDHLCMNFCKRSKHQYLPVPNASAAQSYSTRRLRPTQTTGGMPSRQKSEYARAAPHYSNAVLGSRAYRQYSGQRVWLLASSGVTVASLIQVMDHVMSSPRVETAEPADLPSVQQLRHGLGQDSEDTILPPDSPAAPRTPCPWASTPERRSQSLRKAQP